MEDPDLSLFASGASNQGILKELGKLTPEEREALAEKIKNKLQELPSSAIKERLEQLASKLPGGGNELEKAIEDYTSVLQREKELSSLLGKTLEDIGGKLPGEPGGAGEGKGEFSPGEGSGTQGGLPGEEGSEDQPSYHKSSGTSSQANQGLVYVPQELSASRGEELVLPREGEGKFQVFSSGGSEEKGTIQNFRDVLPSFRDRALGQSVRQIYSPEAEELITNYFQSLEENDARTL